MSKRQNILVVDVETCGGFGKPLVYDLGFQIVERATGRVLESHSLVIEDIFFGESKKMETAYYAEKVPMYHEAIEAGAFRVVSFRLARFIIRQAIEKFNVSKVYAYNCAFDKNALAKTATHVLGRGQRFFPAGMVYCDIWGMACQTVLRQSGFRKFATTHGMVSPAGNFRTSAEVAYAYFSKTPDFVESHTGLDDVKIEVQILRWVLRQKKRVDESILHNPWRLAQVA